MMTKLHVQIGQGGASGNAARFWAGGIVTRFSGKGFPQGTLCVNVAGCFIIGFFGNTHRLDSH